MNGPWLMKFICRITKTSTSPKIVHEQRAYTDVSPKEKTIQAVKRHVKRCPISQTIREIQIEVTIK